MEITSDSTHYSDILKLNWKLNLQNSKITKENMQVDDKSNWMSQSRMGTMRPESGLQKPPAICARSLYCYVLLLLEHSTSRSLENFYCFDYRSASWLVHYTSTSTDCSAITNEQLLRSKRNILLLSHICVI